MKILYISNLPRSLSERDIRKLLAPFGKVHSFEWATDPEGLERHGSAFVRVSDPDRAVRELSGRMVGRRPVFVVDADRVPGGVIAPLPRQFFDECDGVPIRVCSGCSEPLLDGREYAIHKGFFGERCVLEYTVCETCQEGLSHGFSEESKQAISEFLDERTQDTEPDSDTCAYCARPVDDLLRFTRTASCFGFELLDEPRLHCERCEDELHESLSAQTRGEIDRFRDRCLPGVPEAGIDIWSPSGSK